MSKHDLIGMTSHVGWQFHRTMCKYYKQTLQSVKSKSNHPIGSWWNNKDTTPKLYVNLIIILRMIVQREFTFIFPKVRDELQSLIIDNVIEKTIMPTHFKHNRIYCLLTIYSICAWKKMYQLNEPIHHTEDGIKIFGRLPLLPPIFSFMGQISNEIQSDRFPWTLWNYECLWVVWK